MFNNYRVQLKWGSTLSWKIETLENPSADWKDDEAPEEVAKTWKLINCAQLNHPISIALDPDIVR